MENLNKVVSNNLIKFRTLAGLTQTQLAKKIHYSNKSVSKWEMGDNLPDLAVLVKLSEIYNIEIGEFLNENTENQQLIVPRGYLRKRHILISLLSAFMVWFIGAIVFFILHMIDSTAPIAVFAFIYSLPVSAVVLLFFSGLWGNNLTNLLSSSASLWAVLLAICLTVNSAKFWNICFVGLLFQIFFVVWFIIKLRAKNKK